MSIVPAVLASSGDDFDSSIVRLMGVALIKDIQIDVVDGRFASPASWPYNTQGALEDRIAHRHMLPALDRLTYEVDLMCLNADQAIEAWTALGASRFTLHAESTTDLAHLIKVVRTRYGSGGLSSGLITLGLALNIESNPLLIEPHLADIDYVQFMGIARIGRQGQPFDLRVLDKIRTFHARYPAVPLQVDGGVSLDTAERLINLGVSRLVVGSAILRADDPSAAVARFNTLETPFGV